MVRNLVIKHVVTYNIVVWPGYCSTVNEQHDKISHRKDWTVKVMMAGRENVSVISPFGHVYNCTNSGIIRCSIRIVHGNWIIMPQ